MWKTRIADFILRYRAALMAGLLAVTAFMGYQAQHVQWSYNFAKIVPEEDPDMQAFRRFRELFGEDGNMMAIGMRDSAVYRLEGFRAYAEMARGIDSLDGVNSALGLPSVQYMQRDPIRRQLDSRPLFARAPASQAELDSLMGFLSGIKFYEGKLIEPETGATLMIVSIDPDVLNSGRRLALVKSIVAEGERFTERTGVELHYSGLPYVRSMTTEKVKGEMNLFLILSVCMTALILLLMFRSLFPALFSLLPIGMVLVWTVGTMALLGYEITLLTGLLPPILVVIGIPNCVYLLNKFHQRVAEENDKLAALKAVVAKVGVITFITNLTTAIGFFVLTFTSVSILQEFGMVASLSIGYTFLITVIAIPGVFSYLPTPKSWQTSHLEFKPVNRLIGYFIHWVERKRRAVYAVTLVAVFFGAVGLLRIEPLSYLVDDLPEDSRILTDLRFFEQHFKGVMPLEIVVDTGKKKGYLKRSNLAKVEALQNYLDSLPEVSSSVSVVSFLKAAKQAYFGNLNDYDYALPEQRELILLQRYLRGGMQDSQIAGAFMDSIGRNLRVSMKVADIGSVAMDSLVNGEIRPRVQEIFADSEAEVSVTGTTPLFVKGNSYLIGNLVTSMLIAFALIALIMAGLFRNFKIIVISLVPNLVPLLLTAGAMGFLGVPLKPSTAIVFSIAFGISVDDSIHFLAKYRLELLESDFDLAKSIRISLRETGMSMIYTSIILFFGFVIFAGSSFGGTVALGALTSGTLFVAMLTNLILLPALLNTFDNSKNRRKLKRALEKRASAYTP